MGASDSSVCPSCGETVAFYNDSNNLAGCVCGKAWYRKGAVLKEVEMPVIAEAGDLIQPETTGRWNGMGFKVTGRLQVWFEDSAFNYWTLDCSDGHIRVLAEGYGMYAVCEPLPLSAALVSRKFGEGSSSAQLHLFDHGIFTVTAKRKADVVQIEGAIHVPAVPEAMKTIEASAKTGCVDLIEFARDVAVAYNSQFVTPESLNLQNTRISELKGKLFQCPHCSEETNVNTYPYAQSWVCGGCNTRYSLTNGGRERVEHGYNITTEPLFDLEYGATFFIYGVEYKVIGRVFKQDKSSDDDTWKEYTLYDREHGYIFLTESQGHWTLLRETRNAPDPYEVNYQQIQFEQNTYRRFLNYNFRILYAGGEFPGDIFSDHEETVAMDYIAPPHVLSIEKDPRNRTTWFRGQYVKASAIQSQADHALPKASGIAPAQPKIRTDTETMAKSGLIGLLLVLLVQILTVNRNVDRVLLNSTYVFADSLYSQTFLTEKFELEKWKGNMELRIDAPLDNSWLEVDATLVNAIDGTEYSLEQGVEYYSGADSDGSWTEGSRSETAHFTSIPAGTYFLQLTGIRDYGYSMVRGFSVKATYDTVIFRNVLIVAFLVVAWPLIMGIADYYFEKQRWANSPYSTFTDD